MPAAHQIDPDRLPGANQIPERLFLAARHADRMQLARQQQSREQLRVPTIGLDPLPRPARNLRRRRDHALDPPARKLPRQAVPGRARLIRHPHRPRQPGAESGHPTNV